jgi:acyl-homoserine-lactone acylase
LTNPRTGWMQNCNTTPFLLTSEGSNLDPARFPKYMVQEGDNPRGRIARQILSDKSDWTFAEWTRAAFDTRVLMADELLPVWLAEIKEQLAMREPVRPTKQTRRAGTTVNGDTIGTPKAFVTPSPGLRAALPWEKEINFIYSARGAGDRIHPDTRLREAYDLLAAWDHRATNDSIAMTIFSRWRDQINEIKQNPITVQARAAALNEALNALEQRFGKWQVTWGELNRLQRIDESRGEQFDDARASLPIPGVSGRDGAVFTFYAEPSPGQKRFYGVAGATYVSLVEFGPQVRALSIHTFGASGNPQSRHFMDRAEMYARGEFKPAWFTLIEIRANLESSYRPGDK